MFRGRFFLLTLLARAGALFNLSHLQSTKRNYLQNDMTHQPGLYNSSGFCISILHLFAAAS
jgi:hypothetical protein